METKRLRRKLLCAQNMPDVRDATVILSIGDAVRLKDIVSGETLPCAVHMTHWYPVSPTGKLIDGIIRIEYTNTGVCISALTPSRKRNHPLFAWLRELADELEATGIAHTTQFRKNTAQERCIIDAIRI